MADIFVDPIIIVVPAASADEEEVVAYLNTLYRWLEEALHSPHSWFYSNEAAYKLLESGLYPGSELLQYWQRIHRININIRQISTWLNQFFREESNLEPNLEKLGYLIELEPDSITIYPKEFTVRWPITI
ncbi:MAG: hypothetical protein M3Y39_05605, partial [Chloroflexota bacterium]|nr:hypothetical protein [Chloroflexota bacterium]